MSKDPAVLFYTSDFISGTYTMSNEHVGMYIRLLCLQHQKGKLTEQDMLYICSTYVEDVYSKFIKGVDGMYYNQRMFDETFKRKQYSDSRRKNILKRYKKPTYVLHMENENENENKDVIKNNKVFNKPTAKEVAAYCIERNNKVDPDTFINFYESKGWMIGKNKMKCWKSAVRTWEKNNFSQKDKITLPTNNSIAYREYKEPDWMKQ